MKSALFVKNEQSEEMSGREHTLMVLFDSFTNQILFMLEMLNYKL